MKRRLAFALALLVAGCCAESTSTPLPPHESQPCELDGAQRFVPSDPGVYEVIAVPDEILTGCSDGSGQPQPFDVLLADFPDGGPDAEAVVAFKLAAGGCFQIVRCANDAGEPVVYRVADAE